MGGVGLRWASSVCGSAKCEHHAGPSEDDVLRASIQAIADERRHSGQQSSRMAELPDIKAELEAYNMRHPEETQSIFIKGYRLKYRRLPWLKKISAQAGYDRLPESGQDDPTAPLLQSLEDLGMDATIECVPERLPVSAIFNCTLTG